MKTIKNSALLLVSFMLLASCMSVEEKKNMIAVEAYKDIINIGTENYRHDQAQGRSQTGFVYGPCAFIYSNWLDDVYGLYISVRYTVLDYPICMETGDIEDLQVYEQCGFNEEEGYYPVSIKGRWKNWDSSVGSGNFTMTLSESNELCVYIFGDGNWKHWQRYSLTQEQAGKILSLFNSARQKIAALDGTDCEDIEMAIIREKADDTLAKEIFGAGYDYDCSGEYDYQQQLLKKYGYFYFVEDNKLGLADKSGHAVLEPEYSMIEMSENGQYVKLVQNDRCGIASIKGEIIIPLIYSSIYPLDWSYLGKGFPFNYFGEDDPYVLLMKDERCGVADSQGNLLTELKYEKIWGCEKIVGFADGGVDLIDYDGTGDVVHFDCEDVKPSFLSEECNPSYKDLYCCVKVAGKWGVINSKGELVIDTVYDEIPYQSDYDGFSLFCGGNKDIIVVKDGKYGIVDLKGKEMLPCEYDYIGHMIGDNKVLFMGTYDKMTGTFDGKWGLYQDGKVVRSCEYPEAEMRSLVFGNLE